jgi:probable HAF family extracellular repeat protein
MFGSYPQILKVLLVIAVACLSVTAQSPQYTVTDLGAFFYPSAINDSGQVVGATMFGRGDAKLYSEGVMRTITPPDGAFARAWGINGNGDIVGEVLFCDFVNETCQNSRTRGFIYRSRRNTFEILGTLGGRNSLAYAINDVGEVTGYSWISDNSLHAFIFRGGNLTDIGVDSGAPTTLAVSINLSGQVAGHAASNTAARGAFLYDGGVYLYFEQNGFVRDINNSGDMVGGLNGNDDGTGRAFLYSHGAKTDLGMLSGGAFARAHAINNNGVIVGTSGGTWFINETLRAFVHAGGSMQDLNTLVPTVAGRVLRSAEDVNDAGQIVATGTINGEDHGFLLTPTKPLLMTEPGSTKAIAVQSTLFLRDPFAVTTTHNFSTDTRTRLTILVRNMEVMPGETLPPPTVTGEDSQHRIYSLPIEYFGKVPKASWLSQIVVKLPDEVNGVGELQLTVNFRGNASNRASVIVGTQSQ